jgi:hypothetical protein
MNVHRRLAQPLAVEPSTGQPIKLVDVTAAPKNDAGGIGPPGDPRVARAPQAPRMRSLTMNRLLDV